jgi:hypothetical protein
MFELFAETIDRIPTKAVPILLRREYETLQDALLHRRITDTPEVNSVMCFCLFMNTLEDQEIDFPMLQLPIKHVTFYRKIVLQLIAAGEIPETARAKFDTVFSFGTSNGPAKG